MAEEIFHEHETPVGQGERPLRKGGVKPAGGGQKGQKECDSADTVHRIRMENKRLRRENEDIKLMYDTVIKHATSLENDLERRLEEITYLSTMDTLTNIFNRRKFNDCLLHEVEKARRDGSELSLVIYDVDNFKNINDSSGHDYGDFVLVTTTRLIKETMRDLDIFARWGGDEFTILLPELDIARAVEFAEAARKKVETYYKEQGEKITCSFGVTRFYGTEDMKGFLIRADKALYMAKEGGRNRVVSTG